MCLGEGAQDHEMRIVLQADALHDGAVENSA
jgi:hypothetical protein